MSDTVTAARDDGLAKLEAFCATLAATRGRLAALQGELELADQDLSRADADYSHQRGLWAQILVHFERQLLQEAVSAVLAALGGVTASAADMAGPRLGDAAAVLDRLDERFDAGWTETREALLRSEGRMREALSDVEEGAGELEDAADACDQETAALIEETQARLITAAGLLQQTGSELEGFLAETHLYLADGLAPWVANAFGAMRAHLEQEAQPYLTDGLAAVSAAIARGYDDFLASLASVGSSVTEATERRSADAVAEMRALMKEHDQAQERTSSEAAEPLREELAQGNSMLVDGTQVASNLAALLPQLASAKNIVHEIDEMLHFSIG